MATQVQAQTYKNYINGHWVESTTGETFPNQNPATGEVLGHFPRSGNLDIDRAVDAARSAYEPWRAVPAPKRGEVLFRAAELMVKRKEDYARTMLRRWARCSRRRAATSRKPSYDLLHGE